MRRPAPEPGPGHQGVLQAGLVQPETRNDRIAVAAFQRGEQFAIGQEDNLAGEPCFNAGRQRQLHPKSGRSAALGRKTEGREIGIGQKPDAAGREFLRGCGGRGIRGAELGQLVGLGPGRQRQGQQQGNPHHQTAQ